MSVWNIDVPTAEYYGPAPGKIMTTLELERTLELARTLADQKTIAIDTETTGLCVWRDIPLYWSVAWGDRRATLHANTLHYFRDVFEDKSKEWVLANAKYDAHILANVGHNLRGKLIDTCVQHALLYEDVPHGLKYMCKHIGGWTWGDFQDQFGKITVNNPPKALMERAEREDFGRLVEYAANDAWGTLLVYKALREQLEASPTHSLFREEPPYIDTLWDLFYKTEVPYTKTLWRIERRGIKVDRQRLEDSRPKAVAEIEKCERALNKLTGRIFNPNSNPQLKQYFIDEKGYKPLKWTKGGKKGIRAPSVDADFLQYLAALGVPEAQLVLDHRQQTKLLGTYIDGLHEVLDPYDRIHCRLNQDVARTGRLSASDPNLQTIPRPENDKWGLRECFIADRGRKLLDFDYSQLEMRLLAAAAGEEAMIEVIRSGKDIHVGNAEVVFGIPYEDIEKAKKIEKKVKAGELPAEAMTPYVHECILARTATKTIGFGILYGMGDEKLSGSLKIPLEAARDKSKQFLGRYGSIKRFIEESVEHAFQYGHTYTIMGRRRAIPELHSSNIGDVSKGERRAVNTTIQGSAADVVRMAQLLYDDIGYEQLYDCWQVLAVHDELIFDCPEEHVEVMLREIQPMMEHPFYRELTHNGVVIPLEAEGGAGATWGQAK